MKFLRFLGGGVQRLYGESLKIHLFCGLWPPLLCFMIAIIFQVWPMWLSVRPKNLTVTTPIQCSWGSDNICRGKIKNFESNFRHINIAQHIANNNYQEGDGMQEVKITLFNANSGDESWSSTQLNWYQCLTGLHVQDWSHSISLWKCNKL